MSWDDVDDEGIVERDDLIPPLAREAVGQGIFPEPERISLSCINRYFAFHFVTVFWIMRPESGAITALYPDQDQANNELSLNSIST